MAKPKEDDTPAIELIAKFQLDTERVLSSMRDESVRHRANVELRVAQVQDRWTALEQEMGIVRREFGDGLATMRTSVAEVNVALREAVAQARIAADSARVYEKLRDSQPDFARRAAELATKIGVVQDAINTVANEVNQLQRRLDKVDLRNHEFEETKGTVHTMDRIVADLNQAEQRRKKGVSA